MTRKNFWKVFSGKAVLAAVLPLLCLAFAAPAFAQTAEIRSTGVYYIDGDLTPTGGTDINSIYCNWSADDISSYGTAAYKSGVVNIPGISADDPWQTSALIEYDQPYPSPNENNSYPNHCLALCMDVYCTNKPNGATTYSIAFPIQNIMFEIVKYRNGADIANPETNPAVRTIYESILQNNIVDLNAYAGNVNALRTAAENYRSALTELEDAATACQSINHGIYYRNHNSSGEPTGGCITQAASGCPANYTTDRTYYQSNTCEATCTAHLDEYARFATATSSLASAQARLETAQSAYNNADANLANYMCGAYSCMGATGNWETSCSCPNPQYECVLRGNLQSDQVSGYCASASNTTYCCKNLNDTSAVFSNTSSICSRTSCDNSGENPLGETNCIVRAEGTGKGYNDPIRFCTSWDGSYEIQGEFGKTNGQFGFRGTINTEYPGDGIAIENISINQTYPYPGNNQFPIQVDVTNVHTVRTTPTVVGDITGVQATPYSIAYRLSKDADVKIQIFDASAQVPWTDQEGGGDDPEMSNGDAELVLNQNSVVRTLADWEPRLGEGMQGSNEDSAVVESDPWDGRDNSGRLLPANNYLVSVQAKSQDEWPGTDFSRAVTRQLSLDPLKLTDIQVQGLNKQSTAYAVVRYVPTEASNVYFEVYSPGTQFVSTYTRGFEPTGSRPVIADGSGTLVYSNSQQRGRGASYPDQWDGLCHNDAGCAIPYPQGTKLPISGTVFDGTAGTCDLDGGTVRDGNCVVSYANGAPLPDGDYVYVLWAEVPYTSAYFNGAACYVGVDNTTPAGCNLTLNCTGDNGNYSCTSDNQTCSTNGQLAATVPTQCSGAYTAVKTRKYYTGTLPVERGVVDITIQPVSYSTIGSSPTAYGLDPFVFRYSIAREAVVEAYVKNTAGLTVKTLTDEGGNTNVAQQMNTLTWDGRDDQGRMVGPGTYMFVVTTKDPMFPQSVQTQASALFPVDLYRVVDVSTTDVYGDSEARATISYMLSKAMNVQINIYNKDVVIPAQNTTGGKTETVLTAVPNDWTAHDSLPGLTANAALPATMDEVNYVDGDSIGTNIVYTEPVYDAAANTYTYYAVTKNVTAFFDENHVQNNNLNFPTYETYTVTSMVQYTISAAAWPPRVCDRQTDGGVNSIFNTNGSVNPAANPQCIYVNDLTFTNYPATPQEAQYNYTEGARQTLDVRLQPVKTFNRSATRAGDGVVQTEEWDAQYFRNPTPVSTADGGKNTPEAVAACANQTDLNACPYEMIPDGTYPFYVSAQTDEAMDLYYDKDTAQPVRDAAEVVAQTGLYATDKPVYRINITRGPVYFLDGSVAVYPNAPQLFNTSSGPVFVPPYEINFAISRAATVEVAVVALEDGLCTVTDTAAGTHAPNVERARAGDVCKYLSTMTIVNSPNFDPNVVRKIYWDGTDNNGYYVRNGNYEIRLTAKNYPDEGLYQPTVKSVTQNVDLLKVYDLPEVEAYALNQRGTNMSISYQISVPMKVAIQIFKPGTTIYDYQKGTLRDPSTGREVTDIRDVLVRAIVGIRPATTLIEEIWDGTDYAQQDVPDGTYPFRFVTALDSSDIDSVTGEIIPGNDGILGKPGDRKIDYVADTNQYVNLHHATVAIGDGQFVCEDWEKTVFFYPNPFKTPTGTMEITKLPVPGKMSIKLYNLAGDLVREGGYTCVDANNMTVTMGTSIDLQPDNTVSNTPYDGAMPSVRNAALRCFWDRTNDHGKKVARGVYFGLVDFRATNGRQHCQKVVKILIPR